MTTTNSFARQPTSLDYASPTQFQLTVNQLPEVEFFITSLTLPGINLGETVIPTPLKQIPTMGDELTFENLSLSFLVNALATICEEFVGSFCKVDDPVTYFNKQYCKVIRETYDENKEACTSNWNDDWPEDANWRTHELNRIARLEAGKWIHDMEYFRNMALAKEK